MKINKFLSKKSSKIGLTILGGAFVLGVSAIGMVISNSDNGRSEKKSKVNQKINAINQKNELFFNKLANYSKTQINKINEDKSNLLNLSNEKQFSIKNLIKELKNS